MGTRMPDSLISFLAISGKRSRDILNLQTPHGLQQSIKGYLHLNAMGAKIVF